MNDIIRVIAEGSAGESINPMNLFIPEPSEIVWSGIIIVILGVAFAKFFAPMINEILTKRSDNIEGEIAQAGVLKKEAQDLHDQYTNEIKSAKLEAAQIKDDARISANQIIEDAHKKAASEAELILANARRTIESEKKVAQTELMKYTNSIAMNIVQKMLSNGVDNTTRQQKMIDQSIDNYEFASGKGRVQVANESKTRTASKSGTKTRRRIRVTDKG